MWHLGVKQRNRDPNTGHQNKIFKRDKRNYTKRQSTKSGNKRELNCRIELNESNWSGLDILRACRIRDRKKTFEWPNEQVKEEKEDENERGTAW